MDYFQRKHLWGLVNWCTLTYRLILPQHVSHFVPLTVNQSCRDAIFHLGSN